MLRKFRRRIITLTVILALLLGVYFEMTVFAPKRVRLRFETVTSSTLPASFNNSSVAVFSDVFSNVDNLRKAVAHINEFQPDMVLFAGNLFDTQPDDETVKIIQDLLASLPDKLGKYAVLGDVDANAANDITRITLQNAGFRILDNGVTPIFNNSNESIQLVGLNTNTEPAFPSINEAFTLVLAHNPDVIDQLSDKAIHLMVAGKSMNGQIRIPLLGSLLDGPQHDKKRETVNNTLLIQSSGVGNREPQLRLLTNPDVVIITLKNSQ
ncbi:metallophosphoesterase [Erysipelothrix sp. HDW6C]|uniref:metallophosphoesterase n=1 Tax=Erysipelothrix sp. HDW6C TaxID=2714930 RepID=UPI00140A0DC0|nr:metallophosphoesterase [Erysipelothrix sp. HDW6C]QIK70325.1 metallophosphoesterase [Erysipelothrix sp. HDW6C]